MLRNGRPVKLMFSHQSGDLALLDKEERLNPNIHIHFDPTLSRIAKLENFAALSESNPELESVKKSSKKGRKRLHKTKKLSFMWALRKHKEGSASENDDSPVEIRDKWIESLNNTSMKQRETDIKLKGVSFAWLDLLKDIQKVDFTL